MTKPQELRSLTVQELNEKTAMLRKELFDLRGKAVTDKIEKPSRIRQVRKEIARILTILKEKEKSA
ncbi:MAG: 50S ribosomal protein L29 [Candidatus Omnitrophota bacterium]